MLGATGPVRYVRAEMASAIVLAAGFGTRLRPLSEELPKPLLPVGDRSILEHALSRLEQAGFDRVVVNVHHLAEAFEPYAARATVDVVIVRESKIRGTAGGVAGARAHFAEGPVLVWNGDILANPPIEHLLRDAAADHFCLAVAPRRALGEGTLGLDAEGNVVRMRGERFGKEVASGDYIGVLALGSAVVANLPEQGCVFGDAALPRLRAGGRVTTTWAHEPWTDAGDPASLLAANRTWLSSRDLPNFVAPGATVQRSVSLSECVIGAGADVRGNGVLARCVVCPGATATAPLADAIVAPSGLVVSARA